MTLRRSSRLAATLTSDSRTTVSATELRQDSPPVNDEYADKEQSSDEDEEFEEMVKPQRKRQRTKHTGRKQPKSKDTVGLFKNVRGRRGALKDIVEMPLDILHEIFMHLYPVELLHLSRLSKPLRRILMTKSAEFIWKQARFNLDDFPDCPDDLNEPQYACLVFGAICDYCNERKSRYFIWSIRRRCCKRCLTAGTHFQSQRDDGIIRDSAFCFLFKDFPSMNVVTNTEPVDVFDTSYPNATFWCAASATEMRKKYAQLEEADRGSWFKQFKEDKIRRIAHGRRCEAWFAKESERRSSDLDSIRHRRCEAIKERLSELGWAEELQRIPNFSQWQFVKQPKDLTDRIWRNNKDELIANLEKYKAQRLEKEYPLAVAQRRALLAARLQALRCSTPLRDRIFPSNSEMESMEPIKTSIQAPISEQIQFPDDLLMEVRQNWRNSQDVKMRDMVILGSSGDGDIPTPESGVNVLHLATTILKCCRFGYYCPYSCKKFVGYPEVLVHRCRQSWNIKLDTMGHSLAKSILEASGLDPTTTLREELYEPGFYLECRECPLVGKSDGKRTILTWHVAIDHALWHDEQGKQFRIERANLDNVELEIVEKLKADSLCGSPYQDDFACMRCKDTPRFTGNLAMVENHVYQEHKDERDPGELVHLVDFDFEITPSGFRREPTDVLYLVNQ